MPEEILPELVLQVEGHGVAVQNGDSEPLSPRAIISAPACPGVVSPQPGLLPALPDHEVPLAGQLVQVPGRQAKHGVQDVLVSEVENIAVSANNILLQTDWKLYRTFYETVSPP